MPVARTRRTWYARTVRALVWGGIALVASCGGSSTPHPGTLIVTLADSSGDFASYRVALSGLTLTNTNGTVIAPLRTVESVDLASLTDFAEVLQAPAIPVGSYKSATLTFSYTSASIWLSLNGQAVAAQAVDPAGKAVTGTTVTVTFDPNHPLTVTVGKSTRLAVDIDLLASHSINTSVSPPRVTVRPFAVITAAPSDATLMRVRGALVLAQTGASNYIINIRPLIDLISNLGAVTVTTDAQTYFNLNGAIYSGASGLNALAALPQGTLVAAYGTLGDLAGITPGFHATEVYAGTALSNAFADYATGVVSARSGAALTLRGATYISRTGLAAYLSEAKFTVGGATVVSEDGRVAGGLTSQSLSVGQELQVAGQAAIDARGNLTLDATAGEVRLAATRVWGTLNPGAKPGSASLDVLTLANYAPAGFDFAGTGAATSQDANPAAYLVNTGTLDASASAVNTLLQVDGVVTPFGTAPPDFTAAAVTTGAASPQRLVVEWVNGGAKAPFTTIAASGLVVDLGNPNLGTIHEIRTGPATLDLKSLAASPLITTTGADQSHLRLAIGNATLTTGVSVFNEAAAFSSAVRAAFNGSTKSYRLVAVGQYNGASNTFVAAQISVALQ